MPTVRALETGHCQTLRELAEEFERRGYRVPDTRRVLSELAFHLALAVGGWALVVAHVNAWASLLGLLVSTIGCIGVSTNAHTASHFAASTRRSTNVALTYLGFPLMTGISANYWWHKHCARHHRSPNVIGVDDDIDLWPFFALTRRDVERAGPLQRLHFAYQWILLPLGVALNALNMQRQGWMFLRRRAGRRGPRRKLLIDASCLLGHYALWLLVPGLLDRPERMALFYGLRLALLGYAAFAIFAPAHLPAEARCTLPEHAERGFAQRQTCATLNFRVGAVARLFCSGLEYQIEHHLFPALDHTRYPLISADVKAFCERRGYAYRSRSWSSALAQAIDAFVRPKPVAGSSHGGGESSEVPRGNRTAGGENAFGSLELS